MKLSRFFLPLCVVFLPELPAVEQLQLEPVLYVFKDADFARITVGANTSPEPGHGLAFIAPVAFDQQVLALRGAEYTWNGGPKAPTSFSLIATPVITANLQQPATVLCALPIQYLEKAADGSLQVREVPRESPDVPHYQLTFEVRRSTESATSALVTSCQLDMATMTGREKIPGVELETGRPILARFRDRFKFLSPDGEWSGLLIRRPGGSDYSVLMLLKVSSLANSTLTPAADATRAIAAPASTSLESKRPIGTAASGESGLAAFLTISASDSIELKLDWDHNTRWNKPAGKIMLWMTLKGAGPVYRDVIVTENGTISTLPRRGTVTVDPKQKWVVIDLQEIVSKEGEPLQIQPFPANGKYAVEGISTGANLLPQGSVPSLMERDNQFQKDKSDRERWVSPYPR